LWQASFLQEEEDEEGGCSTGSQQCLGYFDLCW
jgi:hypothetical protein